MADADALQFRITAKDETAGVLRQIDSNAAKMKAAGGRGAAGARREIEGQVNLAKAAFAGLGEPLRKLSPELGAVHTAMLKIGKASPSMKSIMSASVTNAAKTAKDQAAQLTKLRQEATRGAARAGNAAAAKAAVKHGLGRFIGDKEVVNVGTQYFGEEREAAGPEAVGKAQKAEGAAYSEAHAQYMADAKREIADVEKGFGEAGVAAEGAEAGVAGLVGSVGGLALAAIGAVAAVDGLALKAGAAFGRTGQGVDNAALATGLDPAVLQRWRGAAERTGVDPHAADQALGGLGLKLHDLSFGMGDAGTANTLAQLGIATPQPGEVPDVDAAMKQIADRLQAIKDPYTKANMARSLGVESLLPLLNKGSAGVADRQAAFDKTGAAYSRPELDKADVQAERSANFEQSKRGVEKRLGGLAADATGGQVDAMSAGLQAADPSKLGDLLKGAGGAVHGLGDAAGWAAGQLQRIVAPPAEAAELSPPGARPRPAAPRTLDLSRVPGERRAALDRAIAVGEPPLVAVKDARFVPQVHRPRRPYAGLTPAVAKAIDDAAASYGLDPEMMTAVAAKESGFRPDVKAPDTWDAKHHRWIRNSATGLFQFTDQTWLATLKKHGGDQGVGMDADAASIHQDGHGQYRVEGGELEQRRLLARRKDPRLNALMAAALTVDNTEQFTRTMGRAPTSGEQYGSHFLGVTGEEKLARASAATPNASAAALFPAEAEHNRSVFYSGGTPVTLEALAAFLQRQAGGDGAPPQRVDVRVEVVDGKVTKVTSSLPQIQHKIASTR